MSGIISKVGACSAVAAGALIVGQETWGLVVGGLTEGITESAIHGGWLLLMLLAVIGIQWAQGRAAGRFAEIATLVAVLGLTTMFSGAAMEVFVLPALPDDSPLLTAPPPGLGIFFAVAFVLYVGGVTLFGLAMWRAAVLPRRAALLLAASIPLALAINAASPAGGLVPMGVAWLWLGAGQLRRPADVVSAPLPTPA